MLLIRLKFPLYFVKESNCMRKEKIKTFLALLVDDQSSLCDTLSSVVRLSVHLSVNNILLLNPSVTKYCRDLFMVTLFGPMI